MIIFNEILYNKTIISKEKKQYSRHWATLIRCTDITLTQNQTIYAK